jgi:tetratricopeptide (TPR) repeat protein
MIPLGKTARRCYRLGLEAAKRRDLSAALRYADCACILDPECGDAALLGEICRYELGEADDEPVLERLMALGAQKKWKAAAEMAGRVHHQSVRLLNIRGCLWALAKRYALAAECFAKALTKDRGNVLAADALAELGRRRKYFWRFFCFSLTK